MTTLYKPETIAEWFISTGLSEHDKEMTHLKLQKLLWYAQGWHLGLEGTRLFDDRIEMRKLGPVAHDVYTRYNPFGAERLRSNEVSPFNWTDVESQDLPFLLTVWEKYGGFRASRLVTMTHSEAPYTLYRDRVTPVPDATMQSFFRSRPDSLPDYRNVGMYEARRRWGSQIRVSTEDLATMRTGVVRIPRSTHHVPIER